VLRETVMRAVVVSSYHWCRELLMRRRICKQLLGCTLVCALFLSAMPTIASAETAFDSRIRAVRSAAARRVVTTDKRVGTGRFTYFTSGNSWVTVAANGWTSGYLPGELWASYSLTGDSSYATRAVKRDRYLKASALNSSSTDIGMRFFYSHVRAYQMTGSSGARKEALAAAGKEAARFNPTLGALKSRTSAEGSQVIIDELINLELLYWGADNGGSASWRDKAHTHALTVARDLVRSDGSVHHIIVYNPSTGAVVGEMAGQGYSVDSMWSRGQAWAVHGFADSYRHTRDPILLETARKVADRYLAELPADMVPYWDFRAPNIPDEPRDSSAAAIAASGLIDLALLDPLPENRARYEQAARATMLSLSSSAYRSTGRNPAILLHGTMNYHSPKTIDVGQSFGDYFFLEALQRLRALPSAEPAIPIHRVRASNGRPGLAVDGSLSTSWTSSGKQWIEFDLGHRKTVSAVSLAVRNGASRSAGFKIYTSNDRRHWKLVSSARSSAETADAETYGFAPRSARYVRVQCSGTSRSRTNGIAEAAVR
jgi:unsaturated chondroitin disaccharide hydrolase